MQWNRDDTECERTGKCLLLEAVPRERVQHNRKRKA